MRRRAARATIVPATASGGATTASTPKNSEPKAAAESPSATVAWVLPWSAHAGGPGGALGSVSVALGEIRQPGGGPGGGGPGGAGGSQPPWPAAPGRAAGGSPAPSGLSGDSAIIGETGPLPWRPGRLPLVQRERRVLLGHPGVPVPKGARTPAHEPDREVEHPARPLPGEQD